MNAFPHYRPFGTPAGPEDLEPEAIRAQLERVLSSPEFSVPTRVKRFLSYVVEEKLGGRGGRLKAYSIAIEIFNRDASFDPQNDPVVRIEAARLRRALERYYLVAGRSDEIRIDVPKGGYIPTFTTRTGESAARTNDEKSLGLTVSHAESVTWQPNAVAGEVDRPEPPRLVVVPFEAIGTLPEVQLYALGVSDQIVSQLARFKEVSVLGRETSRMIASASPLDRIRRELRSDYVVEGSLTATSERIRVNARLVDTLTGAVIWAQIYDGDFKTGDLIDIIEDLTKQIATAIARPYGIVFQDGLRRISDYAPDNLSAYLCVLRFYLYRSNPTAEAHAAGRACLQRIVGRFPGYATAWAMLSYAYLDEFRFGFNPSCAEPLSRALEAAHTAVRLEPENGRALQALMTAHFFNRNVPEAVRIGDRAVALNPNDTEIVGEYGSRLALAGEHARGILLLEQALDQNPGHENFYRSLLAVATFLQGDLERAVREIRQAKLDSLPLYKAVAAIIYAEAGYMADSRREREEFLRLRPAFFENFDEELARRNLCAKDRARFIVGAVKAGFPVRPRPGDSAIEDAGGGPTRSREMRG